MKRHVPALVAGLVLFALPGQTDAYCRSTTVTCASDACGACGKSAYWSGLCVGVSLPSVPTRDFSDRQIRIALVRAFERWMSVRCENGARPSIDIRVVDPAPEAEALASVYFRDDDWPHAERSTTGIAETSQQLALTTLDLDPRTGGTSKARLEINTRDYKFFTTEVPPTDLSRQYDFDFVLTHEIGHLFGIAHSLVPGSVMGTASLPGRRDPTLQPDDIAALCAIYDTDGARAVDSAASPTGRLAAASCKPVVDSPSPAQPACDIQRRGPLSRSLGPFFLVTFALALVRRSRRHASE